MKSEIASLKLFLIKVMLNYSSTEHLIIILDVTLVSRLVRSPLYLSGSAPPPKKEFLMQFLIQRYTKKMQLHFLTGPVSRKALTPIMV